MSSLPPIPPTGSLPAPAETPVLGIEAPWLHGLLLVCALGSFAYILARRLAPLRQAAPDPRLDRLGERVQALMALGFGQARQLRYPVAGTLHILIFFGFLILSLRSLSLLVEGFASGLLDLGSGYGAVKDWTALVVLVCCGVAGIRRLVFRPARYHDRLAVRSHGAEAHVILGLIALLLCSDAYYEGSDLAAAGEWSLARPLASLAAVTLPAIRPGAATDTLDSVHIAAFWIHNAVLLFFLCYLPLSKHFHVLTALPNVFLRKLEPGGKIKPPRHGTQDLDGLETVGVGRLEDFTWKHLLDFLSCTDCGRCSDHCPSYRTGTALSPRNLSVKCRDAAYACVPVAGRSQTSDQRPDLIGGTLAEEEIWACTTCGACEEACPVLIEYVDKIVDLRRRLVEEGEVPAGLQKPLADLEKRGNPFGKPGRTRGEWRKNGGSGNGGPRVLGKGDSAQALFFTDSLTAYDPRAQEVARAFTTVLGRAGIDVGILGKDEVDSGHDVRRLGEEGLFEVLREKNAAALADRDFGCMVTTDPHAFNSLRHEYALEVPVRHHAQVLAKLIGGGQLELAPLADDRVHTFHDPCYLGRLGGEYAAPRAVLDAIPGLRTVEMERCRQRSFCCGGGLLSLFHESEGDERMAEARLRMAQDTGAEVVVTACPYCLLNLTDAVQSCGLEDSVEVVDLGELVVRSLRESEPHDEPRPEPEHEKEPA